MKVRNGLFSLGTAARGAAVLAIAMALAVTGGIVPERSDALVTTTAQVPVGSVASAGAETTSSLATTASADATSSQTTTVTPAATTTAKKKKKKKKLSMRAQVARSGRKHGLSSKEVQALLWICRRESNFHPNSVSTDAYGLFQLNRGISLGNPWRKPEWNTRRAIKYMRGRYGGVLKAKAFWVGHHWY